MRTASGAAALIAILLAATGAHAQAGPSANGAGATNAGRSAPGQDGGTSDAAKARVGTVQGVTGQVQQPAGAPARSGAAGTVQGAETVK